MHKRLSWGRAFLPHDINDPEQRKIASHRLIAKMPTIAAMAYKYALGQPFVYTGAVARPLRLLGERG